MAARERVICASAALVERGDGVRFDVHAGGAIVPAFVVRYEGTPRAYVNACAHVAMELDWNAGKFFDSESSALICSTHGAVYDPATGACRGGPCRGGRLQPLDVVERDGVVILKGSSDG
jgi:nitrite reductase/ring-hydroxylating ferredoxin subunit